MKSYSCPSANPVLFSTALAPTLPNSSIPGGSKRNARAPSSINPPPCCPHSAVSDSGRLNADLACRTDAFRVVNPNHSIVTMVALGEKMAATGLGSIHRMGRARTVATVDPLKILKKASAATALWADTPPAVGTSWSAARPIRLPRLRRGTALPVTASPVRVSSLSGRASERPGPAHRRAACQSPELRRVLIRTP